MGKHRKPVKERASGRSNGSATTSAASAMKPRPSSLKVEARPDWHSVSLPPIEIPDEAIIAPAHVLKRIEDHASSLLDAETTRYAQTQLQSSSSHKFYSTIMNSGTWNDKVSALTLLVQESPVHTTKYFENLLTLAGKKSRSQALVALGAIKDMMAQGVLLPAERKLRMFSKQPGLLASLQDVSSSWSASDPLPAGITEAHLVLWKYEDWLKHKYFEILRILESWCNDEVEFSRLRAVQFVWELLRDKPEQEENLLRLLVNKLGDTSKKVASKASHLLLQLETSHPAMKATIVGSIESEILLRAGQSAHAKYYAVITLNQTVLSTSDPELANKLLNTYFGLFVAFLNKFKKGAPRTNGAEPSANGTPSKKRKRSGSEKPSAEESTTEQQLEDKTIAQVLTGINRAFPYSKGDSVEFEKHLDTMFRISHSSNFNTSVQALLLIQQISAIHQITTDRFMRTLYASLLDPRLITSSKQTMYLNLLYRSLKSDGSIRRVRAFAKRLLQTLSLHEPPFVTAALFLVLELCTLFPSLRTMLDTPELHDDDSDGEEVFRDVPESDDEETTAPVAPKRSMPAHRTAYDPTKRDPLHAHADAAAGWELAPFAAHYHPSVAVFASALLQPSAAGGGKAPPKPDPAAHTLMHFLDRFVYRNAKASTSAAQQTQGGTTIAMRGSSLMQPALASSNAADTLLRAGDGEQHAAAAYNTAAFWERRAADVAADEVFFHRYFGQLAPRRKAALEKKAAARTGRRGGDEDDHSGDEVEDEFDGGIGAGEDEIWKALVGSAPELDGEDVDDDDDADEDDSGFEDEDDEDMDDFAAAMDSDDDDDDDEEVEDDDGGFSAGEFSGSEGDIEVNMDSDDDGGFGEEMEMEGVELNLESDDEESRGKTVEAPEKEAAEVLTEKQAERKAKKEQKRKSKALPMFADVESYAKMLENDSDGEGNDDGDWKKR